MRVALGPVISAGASSKYSACVDPLRRSVCIYLRMLPYKRSVTLDRKRFAFSVRKISIPLWFLLSRSDFRSFLRESWDSRVQWLVANPRNCGCVRIFLCKLEACEKAEWDVYCAGFVNIVLQKVGSVRYCCLLFWFFFFVDSVISRSCKEKPAHGK